MYFGIAESHCCDVAELKSPNAQGSHMKSNSRHIPFAALADLAENRASADERTASMAHVSGCSDCSQQLERVEQVLGLMRTDNAADAPRDLLAYALNIFSRREDARAPSILRRIVAALTFDSSANLAPAFGVRSGQSVSRQLLYSAGENDIDLRLTPADENWIVAGQVLGQDCVGGRVEIEGESEVAAVALNELCEFTLPPVPAGSYTLRLRLANAEVEIPQLELRS
jgi:hypothetical protein